MMHASEVPVDKAILPTIKPVRGTVREQEDELDQSATQYP